MAQFKQVQQKAKILLSYDTDDINLFDIIPIILEHLEKSLQNYEIISSQDAYNNSKGLGAAMFNVVHVIVLETTRFQLSTAYKKEMTLATVSNCNIVRIQLQDVEVEENFTSAFSTDQEQKSVQLQYASNTSDNRLAFNAASYAAIFERLNSNQSPDNTKNTNKTGLIYISCSPSDKDYANKLMDFDKLLKSSGTSTGLSVKFCLKLGPNGSKISEEQAENEIFNPATVAVVLILTQNYLKDNLCLKEAKFAECTRKLIIPTVWDTLDYPPEGMGFLNKTYIDFSQISIFNKDKLNYRIQAIRKKAMEACDVVPFGNYTNTNFIVKNVGTWDEGDVSNWLRYIELNTYIVKFKAQHVNGKVLLSLPEEHFANDFEMQVLHQKVIMTAIDALYDAINWNHMQVMQWLHQIELNDMHDVLQIDASINGKALLVLTNDELEQDFQVASPATRKRLLDEIQLLKLQSAKVPIAEHYHYTLLKDIIKPIGADQHNIFRFHPDIKFIFADIVKRVEDPQFGILQSGLHKFLFVISVLAYEYRNDFNECKLLWQDANKVELAAIRNNYLRFFLMQQSDLERELGKKAKSFLNFNTLYKIMQTISTSLSNSKNDIVDPQFKKILDWDKPVFRVYDLLDTNSQNPLYQQIQQIWLQFVFLENISNELFPIFDRNINGHLTLSEILAGMDVVLFGSTTDKIKMGLCIADEDHDNYLSPEEIERFYIKVFKLPFKAIINSKLLSTFPNRVGGHHTIQSYVYEEIQEELDPTLPSWLNKELLLTHYGNDPEISEGDSVKKRSGRAILTTQGQPLVFSHKEIYMTFALRSAATITNLYLGGANELKDAKYFKKASIWLCHKRYTFNDLKNNIDDKTVTLFKVDLQENQYHFAPEFNPIEHVEYIYIHLLSCDTATALSFFGIWGFVSKLPDGFEPHSTLDLFEDAGGIVVKEQVAHEAPITMAGAVEQFFAMATAFADSGKVPDHIDKKDAGALAAQLEELTSAMPYVTPTKGSTHVNQVRMLRDLLPFTHLFLIFRGQKMKDILESVL